MKASATFTRPADTDAYAAKDTVADATSGATYLTFTGLGYAANKAGRNISITSARIMTTQTTNTAQFKLHLYQAAPTALQDNAACTAPLYADSDKYIGSIIWAAVATEATGSTAAYANNTAPAIHFNHEKGARDIYGILETLDVFTPASGQGFFIELEAEGDDL